MLKYKKIPLILLCIVLLLSTYGCVRRDTSSVNPTVTPSLPTASTGAPAEPTPTVTLEPEMEPSKISNIEVVPDTSYKDFFTENAFSQISRYIVEVYSPDKDLYNHLFKAVTNHEISTDISMFDLTERQIMDTASSLYEQAGFQLFYLNRIKWSQDYKTINFIYTDETLEEIKKYQDVFYSQMNHLLYNVAPKDYTTIQRFFAVYDYITKHGNYTDDMSDQTTFAANSILVKQKGICGGFSILVDYVLNFLNVPTEYLSNEPHAWNVVTLNGNRYHTDFTWGAGNAPSDPSSLNTVLMNDKARMQGLDSMGFGDYPIIFGYPRDNPITPEPALDNQFDFYQDIYQNYALDIENDWVYYSDMEGIQRIHLDGTGKETIASGYGYQFTIYNGVLYYKGDPNGLYQYKPGEVPILLDDSIKDGEYIKIENGILKYSTDIDENGILSSSTDIEENGMLTYSTDIEEDDILRNSNDIEENGNLIDNTDTEVINGFEMDLNEFSIEGFHKKGSNHLETINISKQNTFQIDITFSQQMNIEQLPTKLISLVSNNGQTLPVHMKWNDAGDILTIRSESYINKKSRVILYVTEGILDNNGLLTDDQYDMAIQFSD